MMYCDDCENISWPDLPSEIHRAAKEGNIDKVKIYLDNGGNVNAVYEGECILSTACDNGKAEVVKYILQYRDAHLNIRRSFPPPLNRAFEKGHLECVEPLLNVRSTGCFLEIEHCWEALSHFLKRKPQLNPMAAADILQCASDLGHWNAVKPILETDHHFTKDILCPLVMKAVKQERWDIVSIVLQRNFYGKARLIREVFAITVDMKDWEKVKEFLHLMQKDLTLNIPLGEAALSGRLAETQRLLEENHHDFKTLNGNLLVVASGGTEGKIAELLMTFKNIYTRETLSDALFLTALRCGSELFPKLLNNTEASYSINDLHQAEEVIRHKDNEGYLMTYLNIYLKRKYEIS